MRRSYLAARMLTMAYALTAVDTYLSASTLLPMPSSKEASGTPLKPTEPDKPFTDSSGRQYIRDAKGTIRRYKPTTK